MFQFPEVSALQARSNTNEPPPYVHMCFVCVPADQLILVLKTGSKAWYKYKYKYKSLAREGHTLRRRWCSACLYVCFRTGISVPHTRHRRRVELRSLHTALMELLLNENRGIAPTRFSGIWHHTYVRGTRGREPFEVVRFTWS